MKTEQWKDIKGYEGLYKVSDLGIVKSYWFSKEVVLSQSNVDGYRQVNLTKNKKGLSAKIHRIVAIAFLDNPNNYKEVNHKNFDRSDNRVENLEWVSRRGNQQHRYIRVKKASKFMGVSRNFKKWQALFYANNKRVCLGSYKTEEEASEVYQNKLKEHFNSGGF